MFYTGQKVQCIRVRDVPKNPLRLGVVYTVTGTLKGTAWEDGRIVDADGVLLAEVKPPSGHWKGFNARSFRPLCEPKTSIEIFRKALTDDLIGEEV